MPTKRNSQSFAKTNLPPPRKSKDLRPVSKPFSQTPLNRLIYLLALLSAILIAYYSWRLLDWKKEAGGWWSFPLSHRPTPLANGGFGRGNNRESVEDRVNALAAALGVPPKELASAIAGVVKSYVPPASLSSATIETGTPAESLSSEKSESVEGNKPRPGVLKAVINGVEILVGMDEPPSMEDPLE